MSESLLSMLINDIARLRGWTIRQTRTYYGLTAEDE